MKKIYTILRNNQHEGPFALEEMTGIDLQKHDFIKIEGNRKGWLYAGDISELQPYFAQQTEQVGARERLVAAVPVAPEQKDGMRDTAALGKRTGFDESKVTNANVPGDLLPTPLPAHAVPEVTPILPASTPDDKRSISPAAPLSTENVSIVSAESARVIRNASSTATGSDPVTYSGPEVAGISEKTETPAPLPVSSPDPGMFPPRDTDPMGAAAAGKTLSFDERIENVRRSAMVLPFEGSASAQPQSPGVQNPPPVTAAKVPGAGGPILAPTSTAVSSSAAPAAASLVVAGREEAVAPVVPKDPIDMVPGQTGAIHGSAPSIPSGPLGSSIFVSLPKTARVLPAGGTTVVPDQSPIIVVGGGGRTKTPSDEKVNALRSEPIAAALPAAAQPKAATETFAEQETYLPPKTWTRSSGKKVYLQPEAAPKKNKGTIAIALVVAATVILLGISFFKPNDTTAVTAAGDPLREADRGTIAISRENETAEDENGSERSLPPASGDADPDVQLTPKPVPAAPILNSTALSEKQPVAAPPLEEKKRTAATAIKEGTGAVAKEAVASPRKEVVREAPSRQAPDLTDQIYLASNFANNETEGGIHNISVTVQNKSAKVLKTVAVIVNYADHTGKVLNKQTLYFSDIKAGETVSRPASQHKLANKVNCELGLVSSEGVLYYAN